MLETAILLGFTAILLVGALLKIDLALLLFCGLLLFSGFGLYKGYSIKEILRMCSKGLSHTLPVLLLFCLIGMLTATWRATGTIAYITLLSSQLINAQSLVILTFLLCSVMGIITGSAFATSATMGVICMTLASAMNANMVLVGGAMLSGCYFGDRTSPVGGSSNLVATLTQTDLFFNFNRMLRTALMPFLFCCALFLVTGFMSSTHEASLDFAHLFSEFNLSIINLAPIALIVVLSVFKVPVKLSMLASLVTSLLLCVFVQNVSLSSLPSLLLFGYHSTNPAVAYMVNGGGVLSMVHISIIILCASTYSGLFEETGLLDGLHRAIVKLSKRTTPYTGILATSMLTTGIACDQTLSIMLTHQLCEEEIEGHEEALALDILNSSTLVCALMPWTISCMGCLAFTGASPLSSLCAFFPLFMPVWFMLLSWYTKKNPDFVEGKSAQLLGFTPNDEINHAIALKVA